MCLTCIADTQNYWKQCDDNGNANSENVHHCYWQFQSCLSMIIFTGVWDTGGHANTISHARWHTSVRLCIIAATTLFPLSFPLLLFPCDAWLITTWDLRSVCCEFSWRFSWLSSSSRRRTDSTRCWYGCWLQSASRLRADCNCVTDRQTQSMNRLNEMNYVNEPS